jgi:hypothetical protein
MIIWFFEGITELFVEKIFKKYGYFTLKIITFGRYPQSNKDSDILCIALGIVSIAFSIKMIVILFNSF